MPNCARDGVYVLDGTFLCNPYSALVDREWRDISPNGTRLELGPARWYLSIWWSANPYTIFLLGENVTDDVSRVEHRDTGRSYRVWSAHIPRPDHDKLDLWRAHHDCHVGLLYICQIHRAVACHCLQRHEE